MADNDLQFNIGADASDFVKAIKGVRQGLSDVKDSTKSVVEATSELGEKIIDLIASNPIFKELNRLTGGLADNFLTLGKSAISAFKSIVVGSRLAKLALISTGIGALVVLLGAVAAKWDDIKTLIVGVNTEQRKIAQSLANQIKIQQQAVDLATSQDNTLKLQGKSQKQINNIKIKELKILIALKEAQLSNFRDSIKQAQAQQKAYTDLIKIVANALVAPFKLVITAVQVTLEKIGDALSSFAPATSDLLKSAASGLSKVNGGIDRIVNKIANVVAPDLTSELAGQISEAELEVVKLQNSVDGLVLDNIKIDRSSNKPLFTEDDLSLLQKGLTLISNVPKITSAGVEGLALFTGEFSRRAQELYLVGEALFDQVNELTSQFTQDALGGVGDSLGKALAEGKNVVDAVGNSLLGSLGSLLSELGGLFIKFGIAAGAFAKLKAKLIAGGPIAIALGAGGLVAAGLALKAIGGAISSASKGGGGGGGGGASASSGGGDVGVSRSFSRSESNEQTVVFKISGQNLIGVLRNASNQNARIAGANTLNIN